MYLFDTNIFLEILLDQSEAGACEAAVSVLNEDSPCWVTSFSLHAIEAILSSRGFEEELQTFLEKVMGSAFISRYDTTTEEEAKINLLSRTLKLDFDDALQYYVAKKEKLTLVTLDRDFDKISDVKILRPQDLT